MSEWLYRGDIRVVVARTALDEDGRALVIARNVATEHGPTLAEAEAMEDVLREYVSHDDVLAGHRNGEPRECLCSMCHRARAILARIDAGKRDGGIKT